MVQKPVLQSTEAMSRPMRMAIRAGPSPWEASISPTPRPNRVLNQEVTEVRMPTPMQAWVTPSRNP